MRILGGDMSVLWTRQLWTQRIMLSVCSRVRPTRSPDSRVVAVLSPNRTLLHFRVLSG